MNAETVTYRFGEIEFRTMRKIGLFFPSDKLKARIATLSPEALKVANSEAWKLRRAAERLMRRYSNVTLHGCGPHDEAGRDESVAEAICKATWQQMRASSAKDLSNG